MKSKAPFALIEQLVMVLVFALSAALCVQVFILSDRTSSWNEARDHALVEAQNVAETLKSCHGDCEAAAQSLGGRYDGTQWELEYDVAWQPAADGQASYYVQVSRTESGEALLGSAEITVFTAEGQPLCTLPVAWQEVDAHA